MVGLRDNDGFLDLRKNACGNCKHKLFYHYAGGKCLYDYSCECSIFKLKRD